jgi:hypothetical protein
LDSSSYAARIQPSHTFVQLVGVSHPSLAKAAEFHAIDRASALGAIAAARQAGVHHFIYLRGTTGTDHEELSERARRV